MTRVLEHINMDTGIVTLKEIRATLLFVREAKMTGARWCERGRGEAEVRNWGVLRSDAEDRLMISLNAPGKNKQ